ncbi:MAG TPA: hypothetical protein VFL59_15075 [Candidatus Nanopelagicales bacterium]|nr:hypothetical protein [Candidatus Nanopelagicales bacterium]
MTSPKSSAGTITDPAAMRAELLDRLGLPADASDRDVETVRRAAEAFHDKAPDGQKQWAAEQLADIAAVQSLLDDLGADAVPEGVDDLDDDLDDEPVDEPVDAPAAVPRRRWMVWAVAGVVLAAGAAFGVHLISGANAVPGISGAPEATASPSSTAPALDMAKVGALMQKISANPKDAASYADLASLYFQAQDYANAAKFAEKVVSIEPKNATGWLALGASQFNLGKATDAEKSWIKSAALNPKSAEVHYDLGFLYLSQANPDMAKVKAEWQKVIAIDPTSDIAKNVKTHLDSLASASPAASSK